LQAKEQAINEEEGLQKNDLGYVRPAEDPGDEKIRQGGSGGGGFPLGRLPHRRSLDVIVSDPIIYTRAALRRRKETK